MVGYFVGPNFDGIAFVIIACVTCGLFLFFSRDKRKDSTSAVAPAESRPTHAPRPIDYEALRSLPSIYYGLAMFCGTVLAMVTLANFGELSGAEIGYMIGWIFGSVLSMFAVGRVIELLQQIRDAVRNIPALSPGKPDTE